MNNLTWNERENIFHTALALAGEERNAFLLKACSGDESHFTEISSLLRAFENESEFLDEQVFGVGLNLLHEQNAHSLAHTSLGIYRIGEKIGQGGMGEIYDAFDTKLNRRIALKFIPDALKHDNLAKRQLKREAQAAALLEHKNICAIHDIDQIDEHYFIVMQYIDGITLAEFIKRSPVDPQQTLSIITQIISAVAFAHSHGIIHRDLKPANIMIKSDGEIKILDFGLAKTINPVSNSSYQNKAADQTSQNGLILGTVAYMSPEQLRGEKLDYQSDIFSIGIILYELITGKNPFTRNSQAETIASILSEDPPPPKNPKADLSGDLPAIAQKCLQKDKAKRFYSTAEMLLELGNTHSNKIGGIANLQSKILKVLLVLLVLFLILSAVVSAVIYIGTPKKHSFAVLPITDETHQTEYRYLSEGLTHELIEDLSNVSSLDIKSEPYVSRYKDKSVLSQVAGQELNVDAVLAGSVFKRGESLFLTYKIVKTADGSIIDDAEFLIKDTDLITVRENIAGRVIGKMQLELSERDSQKLAVKDTNDPEALKLYFRGRFFWNRRGPGDLDNAVEAFKKATDLDPAYAKAWAGLADSYAHLSVPGQSRSMTTQDAIIFAKAAAKNALGIDNTLSEPYSSLGMIKYRLEWDWVGAEQSYRTAISLDPAFAPAHYGYSNMLLAVGRLDEALAEAKKTKELDPFSISSGLNLGRIYYFRGEDNNAMQVYSELLEKNPENIRVLHLLGYQYLKMGKLKEATDMFEKVYAAKPLFGAAPLGYCYGKAGRKDKVNEVLQKLDELSKTDYVSSQEKAIVYLGLGDSDNTYLYLEKACREKFPAFPPLISDPLLNEFRSDPRFPALKQCANL